MTSTGKRFLKSEEFKKLTAEIKHKNDLDRNIFDLVLKALYNTADKNALLFEEEILNENHLTLPGKEKKRLWNVLINSGWVSPVIGFGNAGKLTLTKPGYQLMEQYGGYLAYLEAMESSGQSETIIMPINPLPDGSKVEHVTPPQHNKRTDRK